MDKMEPKKMESFTREKRIMGKFYGTKNSPTVIVFAGIHGNEKAGVFAARKVIDKIRERNLKLLGNLHIILGNINALNKGVRFEHMDLNRIWRTKNTTQLGGDDKEFNAEFMEQKDIFVIIKNILLHEKGPFYFLDLHTTSASSVPFITISDSLNNRKFSSNFPIPVVLGIEEYLDGPLLTFINEYGHIALGFEGGSHESPSSVVNCEAFIWKALVHAKCLKKSDLSDYRQYQKTFLDLGCEYQFFAIKYRYELDQNDEFLMRSGFENFEPIEKGDYLATNNGVDINAPRGGKIFMPLYQELGEDGFFILQKISKFWLNASIVARKLKINQFLRLIPGVKKDPENNYTLIVNPKVARFMATPIFHLLGYRQQIYKDNKLHFIKRDRKISELL